MNATTAAIKALADYSDSMPDFDTLIPAHDAAHEFHEAMWWTLRYQRDMECAKKRARTEKDPKWRKEYLQEAAEAEAGFVKHLAEASVALAKMPAKWAAILSCELPKAPEPKDAA